MKKIVKKICGAIAALAICAVAAFNVSLSNQSNGMSESALMNIEALASEMPTIELPEFVITCGQSDGKCWRFLRCETKITPFGFIKVSVCQFNGNQNNACLNGMPCV